MEKIVLENESNIIDYIKVNVLAMKESYQGIINDDFLNMINSDNEINRLIKIHQERLNNPDDKSFILYIDSSPAGVIRIGKSKKEEYANYGEFMSLYLLNKYKHLGYGRKLFQYGINELINMGYDMMILDCLKDNPTNSFYKHFGGKIINETIIKFGNEELEGYIYLFDNLKNVIKSGSNT